MQRRRINKVDLKETEQPTFEEKIVRLEQNFKKICLFYKQPLSYCTAYLKHLSHLQYQTEEQQFKLKMYTLSDETNLIKQGKSLSQNISELISQRQKVLKHLRSELINFRNPKNINLASSVQKVDSIRMYSLNILENLSILAKKLKTTNCTYFWDIIDKISRDIDFLRFSYLRRYIQFSSNHDPLFLVPLKRFENLDTTINYNRKSIIVFMTVDQQFRKRLVNADYFSKRVANNIQTSFPADDIETEPDRYHFISHSSQRTDQLSLKKNHFPQIRKKKQSYQTEGEQKKMVIQLLRQIIEDYHHGSVEKEKMVKDYQSNRPDKKKTKRCLTQAQPRLNYLSVRPVIRQQIIKKYEKYHKTVENESKETQSRNIVRSNNIMQKILNRDRTFVQDQADISKNQQSITTNRNSKYHNIGKKIYDIQKKPYSKSISFQNKSLLGSPKYFQKSNRYQQSDEGNQIQEQIEEQQVKQREINQQSVQFSAKGVVKYKANRVRNNKIVSKSRNNNRFNIKETIANESQIKRDEDGKTFKRQIREPVLNQRDCHTEQIKQDIKPARIIDINRFQSPLDKLLQLRQSTDQKKQDNKRVKSKSQKVKRSLNEIQKEVNTINPKAIQPIHKYHQSQALQLMRTNQKDQKVNQVLQPEYERKQSSFRQHLQNKKLQNSKKQMARHSGSIVKVESPLLQRQSQKTVRLAIQNAIVSIQCNSHYRKQPKQAALKQTFGQVIRTKQEKIQEKPKSESFETDSNLIKNEQKTQDKLKSKPIESLKVQKIERQKFQPILEQSVEQSVNSLKNSPSGDSRQVLRPNSQIDLNFPEQSVKSSHINNTETKPQKEVEPHSKLQIQSKPVQNKVESKPLSKQLKIKEKQLLEQLKNSKILTKSFQSSQLQKFITKKSQYPQQLNKLLNTEYFHQRTIKVLINLFDTNVSSFCLYHTKMAQEERYIIIFHLEIVNKQLTLIQQYVANKFFKYLFTRDPTQKIFVLKHQKVPSIDFGAEASVVIAPITTTMTQLQCFLFFRKQIPCKIKQQNTTIFNTVNVFTTCQPQFKQQSFNHKLFNISASYLKKIKAKLNSSKDSKLFQTHKQVNKYIQEENLPKMKSHFKESTLLTYTIWQDCLANSRFYIHSNRFYFTVEPPFSYLYQNQNVYYLLLATSNPNKYFILADKLYEEDTQLDIFLNFKENVLKRKISDIFMDLKHTNSIVGCPQFKKEIQYHLSHSISTAVKFQLSQTQYTKGNRVYHEDLITFQLLTPFFCAFVNTNQEGLLDYQYTTYIDQKYIIK